MKRAISITAAALATVLMMAPMTFAQNGMGGQSGPSGELMCFPAGMGHHGGMAHHGTPGMNNSHRAEMRSIRAAACSGKAANEPCSFTRPDGKNVNGICRTANHRAGGGGMGGGPGGGMGGGPGGGMGGGPGGGMGGGPGGGAPMSNP